MSYDYRSPFGVSGPSFGEMSTVMFQPRWQQEDWPVEGGRAGWLVFFFSREWQGWRLEV